MSGHQYAHRGCHPAFPGTEELLYTHFEGISGTETWDTWIGEKTIYTTVSSHRKKKGKTAPILPKDFLKINSNTDDPSPALTLRPTAPPPITRARGVKSGHRRQYLRSLGPITKGILEREGRGVHKRGRPLPSPSPRSILGDGFRYKKSLLEIRESAAGGGARDLEDTAGQYSCIFPTVH